MKIASSLGALSVSLLLAHTGLAQCLPERVTSPAPWNNASFGGAVDVQRGVAVIGDPSDHSFCPIFAWSSGAVHVFRRSAENWDLEATLYHSRISERNGGWGVAVAMHGTDRFVATTAGEDGAGAIYMFEHNGEAWREVHEILPVEPEWRRCFGCNLALQGDTLVASQRNDACWVYRERNGRWEFGQKIPAPPSVSFTWYGDGLSLDGDWLAVGAPHDSQHALRGGLVHLYRRDGGGQFELVQTLTPPEPERSQAQRQLRRDAIATDGASVIVGAPGSRPSAGPEHGAAHIFDLPCLLCRADLDGDGELTFFDFLAFQNLFAAGDLTRRLRRRRRPHLLRLPAPSRTSSRRGAGS
jgi:hypothetical protein